MTDDLLGVIECSGCGEPTLVALKHVDHGEHTHHANSYCRDCEAEDPFNRLFAERVNLSQSDNSEVAE